MSHELANINGQYSFAYVGEQAWHGLGQELKAGASIEEWSVAAGMNYTIKAATPFFSQMDEASIGTIAVPDSRILYRTDTLKPLSVMSKKYQIVQPIEILEFFRKLCEENGFQLETAGVLFDGARYWALARVCEDAVIAGEDRIGAYLLLSTAVDGTMATTARFTAIRVVCHNTMSMALAQANNSIIKVRHSTKFDADKMREALGVGTAQFAAYVERMRKLAAAEMDQKQVEAFVLKLITSVSTKKENIENMQGFQKIMELFSGAGKGAELVTAHNTRFGALNAVTEYVDWHSRAKSQEHRMSSAFWGKGDELKNLALELLSEGVV